MRLYFLIKEFCISFVKKVSYIFFTEQLSNAIRRASVSLAIFLFVGFLVIKFLHSENILSFNWPKGIPYDYFFAFYISFTFILFYEVIAMILVIRESVTRSIGKQYEIISLIILRTTFEKIGEYRHLIEKLSLDITTIDYSLLQDFIAGIFGPLLLFLCVRLFYSVHERSKITDDIGEYEGFILVKSALSLLLLFVFVAFAFVDVIHSISYIFYGSGNIAFGHGFFKDFFTLLIFVDLFLVLITIRYSADYDIVFRNSGLAISTVLIRLSFASSSLFISTIVALFALIVGISVSLIYNKFQR